MQDPAVVPIPRAHPLCSHCGKRPALASVKKGPWRVIPHHDVCRQCWRSATDSLQAARWARRAWPQRAPARHEAPPAPWLPSYVTSR